MMKGLFVRSRMLLKMIAFLFAYGTFVPTGAGADVMGPEEIWEGYDPRAEPLDEEILKRWEEDGVSYKEVYFNGEQFDGKHVRIYGVYAAPTGGKNLPALLHIHGGGQTVNRDWLREFSGRGYAILSINWGGEWPKRARYTLWNGVENGDHKKRTGRQVTEPSPRSDAYFLWTQASMRAISYLENQKGVDKDKIGAFGISMGGTIMWNLAFDPRIKAGCAIYGAGWNSYAYRELRYAIGHPGMEASESELRWRASLAPEASAPHVRFPMLFLSSSNDRHGYMDRAEQSLDLIPEGVPRAWALTPRIRHHIGVDFIHDLPAWMDFHLKGEGEWPANPQARFTLGEGQVPVFHVKPDRPQEVMKVEIFHSLENPFAVNRHWRSSVPSESNGVYSVPTPVMNTDEYLFGFANVTYKSGIVISSPLAAVVPDKIGARATILEPSRVFYDGKEGVGDWTRNSSGTDPIPGRVDKRLKEVEGPGGKPGFTAIRVSPMNYAPSDPEFRAPRGASLEFEIKTEVDQELTVKLHKNYWVQDFETFSCKVRLDGDSEWQTATLDGAKFISDKSGKRLGDAVNEAGILELSPAGKTWRDDQVTFGGFRWVGGKYVAHVHAYRGEASGSGIVPKSDDGDRLQDHEAVKD